MFNVRSKKYQYTITDEENEPVEFENYRKAQQAIDEHCAKWDMNPKEFEIVPARNINERYQDEARAT